MKQTLMSALRLYKRFVSPLLAPSCRYQPTCSEFAHDAIDYHGPIKGSLLAAWRLLRCHPFARGGFDPIPRAWPDFITSPKHTRTREAHALSRAARSHNNSGL